MTGRATTLAGIAALVVALQGVGFALLRAPGDRLRPFVDLVALEGLLLGIVGAFLVADRPFLAARAIARRVRGEGPPEEAEPTEEKKSRRRAERSLGLLTLFVGAALFGAAALLWTWKAESQPGG